MRAAGLVTLRQRPATASGTTFITLENEDGMLNVVVWKRLAKRQRRVLLESRLLAIDGESESPTSRTLFGKRIDHVRQINCTFLPSS